MNGSLTAAADVMTGAMVALVPSPADAQRLAIEGGEPVEQLHCTLLYLGDAVDLDDAERAALRAWADQVGHGRAGWLSVEADAFMPSLMNPTGEEPCVAIALTGDELAEFYETTLADVSELVDLPTDMHKPWIPHVTLIYVPPVVDAVTQDVATEQVLAAVQRTGPLVFDRLRVAIGGDVHDVPLGPDPEPAATIAEPVASEGDVTPVPVVAATLASAAGAEVVLAAVATQTREAFDGCLRCFGPIHDGACPPAL